jgi:hypothetical protein
MSVSRTDGHEYFLYFLPAQEMVSLWINDWIGANFDRLASRLGPEAVLITSPEGSEDSFLSSAEKFQWLLQESLYPVREGGMEGSLVLHMGVPELIVSRHPLRLQDPQDKIDCAVINLSAYGERDLARLFDHLINAIDEEKDPLDAIPVVASAKTPPGYEYAEAFELKPNVFGLGINGNAIIRMLREWRSKRQSQAD